jgi:hypothetical protein
MSPTCRPDEPDSPDLSESHPLSPAPSRKRQLRVMTVQVGAALGFLVIRRAGSTPGAVSDRSSLDTTRCRRSRVAVRASFEATLTLYPRRLPASCATPQPTINERRAATLKSWPRRRGRSPPPIPDETLDAVVTILGLLSIPDLLALPAPATFVPVIANAKPAPRRLSRDRVARTCSGTVFGLFLSHPQARPAAGATTPGSARSSRPASPRSLRPRAGMSRPAPRARARRPPARQGRSMRRRQARSRRGLCVHLPSGGLLRAADSSSAARRLTPPGSKRYGTTQVKTMLTFWTVPAMTASHAGP